MKTINPPFKLISHALVVTAIALMMSGCATHKKKKCNTCPKWTSRTIDSVDFPRMA